MSTPIFVPVASVMFVGEGTDAADDCEVAMRHVSILRVKHAAGAIERMLVTRPLVVVLDEDVAQADAAQVLECASDIRAEVLRASAEGRPALIAEIRAAALLAERKRAAAPASIG
jgi:hypothetical protein